MMKEIKMGREMKMKEIKMGREIEMMKEIKMGNW
jgi:hypothetical protein